MSSFISLLSLVALSTVVSSANQPNRILTNPTTKTITYPLIPHSVHLHRRRLLDPTLPTTLPPRPTQSRHSISPDSPQIPHSLRSNPRSLQQQMGALYQGYGTHYIDLWLGSPTPQRQTVIVDTGSGVTAFPCEECKNCGDSYHTDSYYRHSLSKTFRALDCNECLRGFCSQMDGGKKCKISMSYAEGSSWTAYESIDKCYAGGPHDAPLDVVDFDEVKSDHIDPVQASQFTFDLRFGCQTSITGLFITQLADGIMGMENDRPAFWKQMYDAHAIPSPEFSLCFWREDNASRSGTGAGALTFGGVDTRLHRSPMVFATNVKSSGFYAVHLKAIYLREGGGNSAKIDDMAKMHKLDISESALNRGNVIVDSGTTDSYFTRELNGPFQKVWTELMGNAYNHGPVALTPEDIAALPTIILVIQGHEGSVGDEVSDDPNTVTGLAGTVFGEFDSRDVVLAIPGSHYMEFDPDSGKYVARFYTDEGSGSVLGANAMMGHDIYFDTTHKRIGFAESDCDYNALLEKEGKSISVAPEGSVVSAKLEEGDDAADENDEYGDDGSEENEDDGGEEYGDDGEEEYEDDGEDEYGDDGEEFVNQEEFPEENNETVEYDDGDYEDDEVDQEYGDDSLSSANPEEKSGNLGSGTGSTSKGGMSTYTEMANSLLEDMKHECSTSSCRGVAAFLILAAASFVLLMIRRTIARRRVVRQYQEAELEISDLALDSDSDEDGGYVDDPTLPRIS